MRKEGIKSWYCISTHGYAPKKWKHMSTQKLFVGVYSSIAYTVQRCKYFPKDHRCHNGIVFGSETEWSIGMCFNINEPWEHYGKKNKSNIFLPRIRGSEEETIC